MLDRKGISGVGGSPAVPPAYHQQPHLTHSRHFHQELINGLPCLQVQRSSLKPVKSSSSSPKGARKVKTPKFYAIGPDPRIAGEPGWRIQNLNALLMGRPVLCPPIGLRGFDAFPEAPLLVIDPSSGRAPYDLEQCYDYWLVSDALKNTLERIDAGGVAFVRCEVWLRDGDRGPSYWLCDILRLLDAVDEANSHVTVKFATNRIYSLLGGASLAFKTDVVNRSHLWRTRYLEDLVFCDDSVREACKEADLAGMRFRDASKL